jgi:hemerythrin
VAMIQWNDSLKVNIAEVDRQHEKLIFMINSLDEAQRQGKGKEIIGKIVNGLISYTGAHFKLEEDFFDRFDYPDSDNHKKAHAQFVAKVSEFRDGLMSNKLGLSMDVMNFLSDWLKTHIMGNDMKYAPFLIKNGVK